MTPKNNSSAPALENALRIINYMAQDYKESYGISELSKILHISNNMTYRIMTILSDYQYLQVDASGKYALGSKLFSIGMKLQDTINLRNCTQPWLSRLCQQTGEVSHIQIADGNRCLLTECIVPDTDFYFYVKPGSRLYYHANAFGKAMLAFFEKEKVEEALSDGLVKLTSHTATNFETLEKMLEETRRTGLSYDLEEYNSGIYCVGAPIFNVLGEAIAGVGIIGFVSALDEKGYCIYKQPVLECAKQISTALGYDGNLFKKWM